MTMCVSVWVLKTQPANVDKIGFLNSNFIMSAIFFFKIKSHFQTNFYDFVLSFFQVKDPVQGNLWLK